MLHSDESVLHIDIAAVCCRASQLQTWLKQALLNRFGAADNCLSITLVSVMHVFALSDVATARSWCLSVTPADELEHAIKTHNMSCAVTRGSHPKAEQCDCHRVVSCTACNTDSSIPVVYNPVLPGDMLLAQAALS